MNRKLGLPAAGLLAAFGLSIQPAAAAPGGPDGEVLFRQRCQSCHSVTPSRPSTLAPSLIGVVGRKAAATTFNYSPALKNSKVIWNRANLDRYVAGPARMVPGTRMVIAISDPTQRAAIIDYLAKLR